MRRGQVEQPTLITSVPSSPDAEYDHRRKRYALMMGMRALCVVAAALTYHVSIWLAFAFVLGGTVLPWCAVILANDGPPRKVAPRPPLMPNSTERALPGNTDHTVSG